ncbi:MAG: hypothetical protein BWY86_00274 [Candidatus Aminicenantes bacterium ADurb.Bin508]|nr:MAG: hypothetical protein BWY86_00274 [Candidatus Aminicenantes bacterium ADurb.Bin508]
MGKRAPSSSTLWNPTRITRPHPFLSIPSRALRQVKKGRVRFDSRLSLHLEGSTSLQGEKRRGPKLQTRTSGSSSSTVSSHSGRFPASKEKGIPSPPYSFSRPSTL